MPINSTMAASADGLNRLLMAPTMGVSKEHPEPGKHHKPRQGSDRETSHLSQLRVDVAIPAIEAYLAEYHPAENQPRGQGLQEAELALEPHILEFADIWHEPTDGKESHHARQRHEQKRQTPRKGVGDQRAQRHSHKRGHVIPPIINDTALTS